MYTNINLNNTVFLKDIDKFFIVGIRSDVNKVFKPPIEKITDPKKLHLHVKKHLKQLSHTIQIKNFQNTQMQ